MDGWAGHLIRDLVLELTTSDPWNLSHHHEYAAPGMPVSWRGKVGRKEERV